jgi:hypothetical protein
MVVYILCYDYSASHNIQDEQLSYWLDFLQSTLPTSPEAKSKWRVMVVGTKRDMPSAPKRSKIYSLPILLIWKLKWPNIFFLEHQFFVSSHKMKGIDMVLRALDQTCSLLIELNYLLVPHEYNALADAINSIPQDQCIIPISKLEDSFSWGDHGQFQLALKYLHAIGQIVLLHNGLVCVSPQVIPKITAEFISPEAVRHKLMTKHRVVFLNKRDIRVVLEVAEENEEYVLHLIYIYFD